MNQDNLQHLGLIVLIALLVVGVIIFACVVYHKIKKVKVDSVYFVSGGVKTGKSVVSVFLVIMKYLKNVLGYYIRLGLLHELRYMTFNNSAKIINAIQESKKPMLYSNIPLRYIRYNNFTKEILFREVRIPNKSCLLIDEASLVADSMLYGDKDINSNLLVFYKLWGHYSHGGTMLVNSQAIGDNHYSLKRCMSKYLYIYSRTKVPFVTIFKVREMVYSDDNSNINVTDKDIEKSDLMTIIMPNFIYKLYDCYCYSIFTDELTYQVDYDYPIKKRKDSLKQGTLVTLQDFKNLDRRQNHEA